MTVQENLGSLLINQAMRKNWQLAITLAHFKYPYVRMNIKEVGDSGKPVVLICYKGCHCSEI